MTDAPVPTTTHPSPLDFVHLRLHSEYSITEGIVRIGEAVECTRADGMGALALTDRNNLFGWVRFYNEARKAGIKPLAGAEVTIAASAGYSTPYRLLFLVRNAQGYHALCRLLSSAWLVGQREGEAQLPIEQLEQEDPSGLILLSGAAQGDVGLALSSGQYELARRQAEQWKTRFGTGYYLEIQRTGDPITDRLVAPTLALAEELAIPVVATHPIQFTRADDFKAHEARVCIAQGKTLNDKNRPRHTTLAQYFKPREAMKALFADIPEALQNTVKIAQRCNLELQLGKPRLPDFPTPPGESLDDYLRRLAEEGLERRLLEIYPEKSLRDRERATYQARLVFESKTIVQMGFSGYFLIVADFINWAKARGIPVGPGRGSGAGSLIAYCLGITDLDPLRYDLLFERFLNPERVSMPDFDIDFCQDGRDAVIDYVRSRYGVDSVSQIATFGTMAAKAVIRDVGRVLDLPYHFVDQLAKLIPFEIGMTLRKARLQEPQINQRAAAEEEVAELLALAEKLEGITRNVGMHAGGVLIAPGRLTDFTPLYVQEGSTAVVSQYDKDDVEKVGLVKFDFLGLRTLTILDWTERHIRSLGQVPESTEFRISAIPLNDPATYALFSSGNTTAVFQQESRSAKDLEKRLKPDTFEDLIALMALNRPGPLQSGMVDDFIQRKQGKARVDYFHHSLEPVLQPTYGVIVYQEQVMQIAQVLAGYTLGGADLLRRAMGKKDGTEMARHRTRFIDGATERGVPVNLATQLFDLMEKFAEYGFNKSHSAAYALISYQTAWLKVHHPAAFMAATLSGDLDDTDKVALFVEDARANHLLVLAPDINTSCYRFMPVNGREIRYGLGSVKGTGEAAALAIEQERLKRGSFLNLFEFCSRLDKRVVNRRVVEALIKAGAFDALNDNRAALIAQVDSALAYAEQNARHTAQSGLFDLSLAAVQPPPVVSEAGIFWSLKEKLSHEKSVLGYYFSGHPFSAYQQQLEGLPIRTLAEIVPQQEPVRTIGIVSSVRIQQTRRGRMAIVTLDDGSAKVEVSFFSERFEEVRSILQEDRVVYVEGRASLDNFTQGIRINGEKALSLDAAKALHTRHLTIQLHEKNGVDQTSKLLELLKQQPAGHCKISIQYTTASTRVKLAHTPILPNENLLVALVNLLGTDQFMARYDG